jgi:hypothetical protein
MKVAWLLPTRHSWIATFKRLRMCGSRFASSKIAPRRGIRTVQRFGGRHIAQPMCVMARCAQTRNRYSGRMLESSDPRIRCASDAFAHPGEAVGLRHSFPPGGRRRSLTMQQPITEE